MSASYDEDDLRDVFTTLQLGKLQYEKLEPEAFPFSVSEIAKVNAASDRVKYAGYWAGIEAKAQGSDRFNRIRADFNEACRELNQDVIDSVNILSEPWPRCTKLIPSSNSSLPSPSWTRETSIVDELWYGHVKAQDNIARSIKLDKWRALSTGKGTSQ